MVQQSFQSLISLLEQELAIYTELADLLKEESQYMLQMNVERVSEIVTRKETLVLRIKALDESRKMLARRLGQSLGLPSEQITITRLAQAAGGTLGAQLAQVGATLKQTVLHCQDLNTHNEKAARRGLELINGTMKYLIEHADPAGRLYQAPRARGAHGAYAPGRGAGTGASGFVSRLA